ncbi:unnamed protein product [Macrosiphum euphorbiae]|uniref:Tc1-like transposase DDE domain-containing protein n=1 Tax=Macrosiphum euphorbiae TaxID=13131 RepID=A0AAV0XKX7_9HEMI|nr:unnamed protein product [Macrosiphum euphorbiae]
MSDNETMSTNTSVTLAVDNLQNQQVSLSSPVKKNRCGAFVGSKQRILVINMYKAKIQKQPDAKFNNLMKIISEESGIGYTTVCKTVRNYKNNKEVKSPNKTKNRPTINDKVDDFEKNAIRQKIHGFWIKNEIPTLKKIVQAISDDMELPTIPRTSLQRILKELGFEYTKRNRNSALTERGDIVVWRQKYILDIRRYRNEGRTIYFLDETWVNAGETCNKVWMDKTIKSHRDAFLKGLSTGPKNPTGKGKRLIVVHIGSAEGFVEGGLLCFESKKNTADYHDEMNGDTFYDWFCGILPKLKDNSVIVMDNASYHSVKLDPIPTNAWKKDKIVQWLSSKGCSIETPMVKHLMLDKVKEIRHLHDKYVIDEEASKSNKIVLRLPPYHCELNPIELAWAAVKIHVKYNNTTFKLNDVQKLLVDGVNLVTPDMWANFVRHTIKEEDKLFNIDFITEEFEEEGTSHVLTITGDTSSDCSD